MEELGPPEKKSKVDPNDPILDVSSTIDYYIQIVRKTKKLRSVISDEYTKPLPTTNVYIGTVRNPKDLSKVVAVLNEKIPLKDFNYLKRVYRKEVLLCPVDSLTNVNSIQEYLEYNVPELKDIFEFFKEKAIPAAAPKVKRQCNNIIWSFNFHPNKYYERLVSDNFFTSKEMIHHQRYMEIAFEAARFHMKGKHLDLNDVNAAVVVDPNLHFVVAVSFCGDGHPLKHAAMLAIDNVAKTQKGGVWNVRANTEDLMSKFEYTTHGIDENLHEYLKKTCAAKYGAKPYLSKSEITKDTPKSDAPYLCTGYYIYMLREPCVMCGMALVHARVKRIFYMFPNQGAGALSSATKLQCVPALNHHFEVFTGYL